MDVLQRFRRGSASLDARVGGVEKRLKAQGARLDRQQARLDQQRAAFDSLSRRTERRLSALEKQSQRLLAQRERVAEAVRSARKVAVTLEILASHVGALETRIADLTERTAPAGVLEADAAETAGSLLDEVRAEHARIRTRFGAMTIFEERLRRLEEGLLADTARTREEFERAARLLAAELGDDEDPAAAG